MTQVNLPDGTQVNFPDSMSNDEIRSVLQKKFGAPKPKPVENEIKPFLNSALSASPFDSNSITLNDNGKPINVSLADQNGFQAPVGKNDSGKLNALQRGIYQGSTLNFGDEISAGINAGLGYLNGEDFSNVYNQSVKENRFQDELSSKQHPRIALAGNIAGGVLSTLAFPGLNGAKYVAGAKTGLGTVLRSGLVGGALGGISGAGAGEDARSRARLGTTGAVVGGAIGAATPVVFGLFGKGYSAVKSALSNALGTNPSPVDIPLSLAANAGDDLANALPEAELPINNKINDILTPVKQGGRKTDYDLAIKSIAEAMRRDGVPVDKIQQVIPMLGESATIADSSGRNVLDLLQSAASQPGAGKQIASNFLEGRQALQRNRIINLAQDSLGASGKGVLDTADDLIAKQQAAAAPLYQEAFDNSAPVDTSDILESINSRLNTAKGGIKTTLDRAKNLLLDANGNPETSLQALHEVKLAFDDAIDSASKDSSIGKVARRELIDIQKNLLSAIDESNPKYAEARAAFAGYAKSQEALDLGRNVFKGDAELNAREFAKLSPSDQEFIKEGGFSAIKNEILNVPRTADAARRLEDIEAKIARLRPVFNSDEAFQKFRSGLQGEIRKYATLTNTLKGSQTQARIAAQDDLAAFSPFVSAGQDIAGGDISALAKGALKLSGKAADYATGRGNNTAIGENARAELVKALLSSTPEEQQRILQDITRSLNLENIARSTQAGSVSVAPRLFTPFNQRRDR